MISILNSNIITQKMKHCFTNSCLIFLFDQKNVDINASSTSGNCGSSSSATVTSSMNKRHCDDTTTVTPGSLRIPLTRSCSSPAVSHGEFLCVICGIYEVSTSYGNLKRIHINTSFGRWIWSQNRGEFMDITKTSDLIFVWGEKNYLNFFHLHHLKAAKEWEIDYCSMTLLTINCSSFFVTLSCVRLPKKKRLTRTQSKFQQPQNSIKH